MLVAFLFVACASETPAAPEDGAPPAGKISGEPILERPIVLGSVDTPTVERVVGAAHGPAVTRPCGYDVGVAIVLPPSLRRELHSVEDEVRWARELTPEQRLAVVAAVCRDAVTVLNMNANAARVLELRDPVPASTVAALLRLRL